MGPCHSSACLASAVMAELTCRKR